MPGSLNSLKSKLDDLDLNKLEPVSFDLKTLRDVVEENVLEKLNYNVDKKFFDKK